MPAVDKASRSRWVLATDTFSSAACSDALATAGLHQQHGGQKPICAHICSLADKLHEHSPPAPAVRPVGTLPVRAAVDNP
jgi:hypothetical protein